MIWLLIMKAVRNFLAEKAFFAMKRDAGARLGRREVGDCEKDLDRRIEDLRLKRDVSGFTVTRRYIREPH